MIEKMWNIEIREWLKENSFEILRTRFQTKADLLEFVERLYEAGAVKITVEMVSHDDVVHPPCGFFVEMPDDYEVMERLVNFAKNEARLSDRFQMLDAAYDENSVYRDKKLHELMRGVNCACTCYGNLGLIFGWDY
jgi:hypothetical protein